VTSFALKIIALTTMIIDHIGDVWSYAVPEYFFMRSVGRVAFPIYAFLIAEGCRRTKNLRGYMTRLGVFALISEIPFDLCFENGRVFNININNIKFFTFENQNVFFTLFLSVCTVYVWEQLKETRFKYAGLLAFPAAMAAAEYLNADYGAKGVVIIVVLYFLSGDSPVKKITRSLALVAGVAALYLPMGYSGYLFGNRVPFGFTLFLFACVPAVLVLFYNGKRGPAIKYFFYLMYPLHLLAIFFLHTFSII